MTGMSGVESLSCIIVTYNSLNTVDECLASLLASGLSAPQIHIVDNNSVDETVPHILRNYPGVEVIRSPENLGFSKANNLGVRESLSELVMFANPDVIFLPGAVEELVQALTVRRATGICGPLILDRDLCPKPESYLFPVSVLGTFLLQFHLWKLAYHAYKSLDQILRLKHPRRRAALSGACMVVRREDFVRVGGFDEDLFMYGEDFDLCEKVLQAGLEVVQVPAAKIIHIGGGTYTNSRAVFFNYLKSLDTLFLKNSDPLSLVVKRALVMIGLSTRWSVFKLLQRMGLKEYKEISSRLEEGLLPFLSSKLLHRTPLDFPRN